jgi:hypothetical protein
MPGCLCSAANFHSQAILFYISKSRIPIINFQACSSESVPKSATHRTTSSSIPSKAISAWHRIWAHQIHHLIFLSCLPILNLSFAKQGISSLNRCTRSNAEESNCRLSYHWIWVLDPSISRPAPSSAFSSREPAALFLRAAWFHFKTNCCFRKERYSRELVILFLQ